jgi:hypothetical protein
MRDVVVVFAILLVLLLIISTLGGSIRYNMPPPKVSQQQQFVGSPFTAGGYMYPERFSQEAESDTYEVPEKKKAAAIVAPPPTAPPAEEGDMEGFFNARGNKHQNQQHGDAAMSSTGVEGFTGDAAYAMV